MKREADMSQSNNHMEAQTPSSSGEEGREKASQTNEI